MAEEDRQTEMALLPPRVEDQELSPRSEPGQGLDVADFARNSFESAVERFKSAGDVNVDPEDPVLYNAYRRSLDYLGDMALGGLDLSDAAFRAAVGIAAQALPEDQERRFARDLAGMPEAFLGVSPGRIAAATDEVMEGVAQVGRNLNRRDEMPVLGSNLGNVGVRDRQPARTPQPLFRESDPLQQFGVNTIANFYSPVNQVIEEANFPKRGMRGADVERLLRDSDIVRNSEVSALELSSRLNPQQRYTREEVLREIEPLQFNVRADRVTEFDAQGFYPNQFEQRQPLDDLEDEYHETIIRASRNDPDLSTFRATAGTHYTPDTIAHLRTSTRFGPDNKKYYLVEEIQSDLIARGAARSGPERTPEEALREHFDSVIFPEAKRDPNLRPLISDRKDELFEFYKRSANSYNPNLELDVPDIGDTNPRLAFIGSAEGADRRSLTGLLSSLDADAFRTSTNIGEISGATSPAPIKDVNEVVRIALQTAISDAIQSGANSVVIPNLERIVSSGRARPGTEAFDRMTSEGSSFYRTYVTGLKNALEEIKRDLPDIEVSEVDLPYNRYTRNDILLDEGDDGSDLLSTGEEILPTNATRIDISEYAGSNLNELRFAEGGAVTMERQMELFEREGGLADDGARMDPVSGNDIPPGSMAEEVRDDVPAQLSEGEYVVPADVVRYYGVKFFEDLRMDAKRGLTDMEQNGRIGGEPMDPTPGDEPLTAEEMQMLAEITGMYAGGDVQQPSMTRAVDLEDILYEDSAQGMSIYDYINSPIAINTPYGDLATTPEMKRELFRKLGLIQIADAGMAQGGMVAENQMQQYNPYAMQQQQYAQPRGMQEGGFQAALDRYAVPGASVFGEAPSSTEEDLRSVTLFGPNGEIVSLILPTEQERYDTLISQGYSENQDVVRRNAQIQQQRAVEMGRGPGEGEGGERDDRGEPADTSSWGERNFEALSSDPLAFGREQLQGGLAGSNLARTGIGVLGGINPAFGLIGTAVNTYSQARNYAEAMAAANIAEARGDVAGANSLRSDAQDYFDNMSTGAKNLIEAQQALGIEPGSRLTQTYNTYAETSPAAAPTPPTPDRGPSSAPTPPAPPPASQAAESGRDRTPPSTQGVMEALQSMRSSSDGDDRDDGPTGGSAGTGAASSGSRGDGTRGGGSSSSSSSSSSSGGGRDTGSMSSSDFSSAQEAGKGYSGGYGFEKGGLIERPKKKRTRKSKK